MHTHNLALWFAILSLTLIGCQRFTPSMFEYAVSDDAATTSRSASHPPATPASIESKLSLHKYREVRFVMGSLLDITVYHQQDKVAQQFFDEAFETAQQLDLLLSTYRESSEISLLNRIGSTPSIKVSQFTCEMLRIGKALSIKTEGSFALSVRPLTALWESTYRTHNLPSKELINSKRLLVDDSYIEISGDCMISFQKPQMAIETGGIGKGYCVDKIADLLAKHGIENALINFGLSSIYARGAPPEQKEWRIRTEFPDGTSFGDINISGRALSASYTHGKSVELNGVSYGHIVDTNTGYPITEKRYGVATCQSATSAEVYSKYLIINGKGALDNFFEKIQDPCQLLLKDENGNYKLN